MIGTVKKRPERRRVIERWADSGCVHVRFFLAYVRSCLKSSVPLQTNSNANLNCHVTDTNYWPSRLKNDEEAKMCRLVACTSFGHCADPKST